AGTTYEWKRNGVAFSPAQTGPTLNLSSSSVLPAPTTGMNTYSLIFTQPGCSPLTDQIVVQLHPALNVAATIPPILACNTGAANYTFDLNKNLATLSAGQVAGTTVNFYASNLLAEAGTAGTELPVLYTILSSESGKTIHARITNPTTQCYEVRSFQLT